MFNIYLWDAKKYVETDSFEGGVLKKFHSKDIKNSFLIQDDEEVYPLLSNLSFCEEDVFSEKQLDKLYKELSLLLDKYSDDNRDYILDLINFISEAIKLNKSVLFSPF